MSSKKTKTRQLIIDAANDLFMNLGFKTTSTRMIAKEAGITQPNLYHYFSNKEEIYIAVFEDLAMEVGDTLQNIVDGDDMTLIEKLEEMTQFLKDKHPVNLFIMRHDMTNEISENGFQQLYAIWSKTYLQPLITLFKGYQSHIHSDISSEILARHFFTTLAPYIQKESDYTMQLTSEQIIHLFVYGILDKK